MGKFDLLKCNQYGPSAAKRNAAACRASERKIASLSRSSSSRGVFLFLSFPPHRMASEDNNNVSLEGTFDLKRSGTSERNEGWTEKRKNKEALERRRGRERPSESLPGERSEVEVKGRVGGLASPQYEKLREVGKPVPVQKEGRPVREAQRGGRYSFSQAEMSLARQS